jgi:hypothetical protein
LRAFGSDLLRVFPHREKAALTPREGRERRYRPQLSGKGFVVAAK